MNRYRHSRAFTLVEVLIAMLLVGLGLLAVIAMTVMGTREAVKAVAMATAFTTARSALYDPALLEGGASLSTAEVSGFLNGYFVVRRILDSSAIPAAGGTVDRVRVDVYWGSDGVPLAGVTSLIQR